MPSITAKVKNGRLTVDLPTDLPEGSVLELAVYDPGDDLSDQEHKALLQSIADSIEQAKDGRTTPAEEVLAEIQSTR